MRTRKEENFHYICGCELGVHRLHPDLGIKGLLEEEEEEEEEKKEEDDKEEEEEEEEKEEERGERSLDRCLTLTIVRLYKPNTHKLKPHKSINP